MHVSWYLVKPYPIMMSMATVLEVMAMACNPVVETCLRWPTSCPMDGTCCEASKTRSGRKTAAMPTTLCCLSLFTMPLAQGKWTRRINQDHIKHRHDERKGNMHSNPFARVGWDHARPFRAIKCHNHDKHRSYARRQETALLNMPKL